MERTKKQVLFLCTGNSCRSQMAEGWLRHLAGEQFEVASAGTKPQGLNPHAVESMIELGIDMSGHQSKPVEEILGQSFDFVITVCDQARESCPVFPGHSTPLHWSFPDPATAEGSFEERRAVFRQVRDAIENRIQQFLEAHP